MIFDIVFSNDENEYTSLREILLSLVNAYSFSYDPEKIISYINNELKEYNGRLITKQEYGYKIVNGFRFDTEEDYLMFRLSFNLNHE